MVILSCEKITKSFGIDTILNQISFSVNLGARVGIIGSNGAGKSTLFRIILEESLPDSGNIYKSKDTSIGYLAQDEAVDSSHTIWEELLQVFTPLIEMEKQLRELEQAMGKAAHMDTPEYSSLLDQYAALSEEFEAKEGYSYQSYIRGVLAGLGFTPDEYEQPIYQLSGGQKTRVALARLLLLKPNLLLLDEPTNHLDLNATQWLEDYLRDYPGTIMLISHDRYFLDRLCDSILEIENNQVNSFSGNYSTYKIKKAAFTAQQEKDYELQQKEVARQEAIIERYKSYNREKSIRAAESRQKRLDKIDRLDKPFTQEELHLSFDASSQSGYDVLKVNDLSKSFEDRSIFQHISFSVHRGDRVGIIGPNGVGKSTLFKILLGQIPSTQGSFNWGTGVTIGYYDQEQSSLTPQNSILDEVWGFLPHLSHTEVRNALAAFLFKGEDVYKTIETLSGGERGRVLLAKLILSKDNLLLLDEPTNHLDMDSKESLELALSEYPGTVLVISHDRYFLNKIVDRILVLEKDGVNEYLGNYDDYLEKKNVLLTQPDEEPPMEKTKTALKEERRREREERQQSKKRQQELKSLESEIQQLEARAAELEETLCDPTLYQDVEKMKKVQMEYDQTKQRLNDIYEQWLVMSETLSD